MFRRGFLAVVLLLGSLLAVAAGAPEDPDVGAGQVARLVRQLGSDSFGERQDAYDALAALGSRALPWLEKYRDAKDPEVAQRVARLLAAIESREGRELLTVLARHDNDFPDSEEFRRLVARGRALLPDLYRVLDEEDAHYPSYDFWRMKNAYAVIRELVTEEDLDELLSRLDHPNPQSRYLLLPILKRMDREVVRGRLLEILVAEDDPPLLRAQVLEMCRDSALTSGFEDMPALAERLLADAAPEVRAAALSWWAFSGRREEAPVEKILAATGDEDVDVRVAAVRVLRNLRAEGVRKTLERCLSDPEGAVRAAALDALRNAAGPDLAPLLRPFLRDPDPIVRSSAAQTLAQLGDQAALPTLVELLDERSEEFLMRALHSVVSAVSRLGDRAAIPPLLHLLEDSEEHTRIRSYRYLILSAILNLGGDEALPKVKSWITDREIQNRQVVLDALGRLESDEILPILVDALANGTGPERTSAVRALVRRGHRAAAPAIRAALTKEEDPWFLSEAVKALLAFGDDEAVPEMQELLDRDPKDTRNIALFYSLMRAMVLHRVAGAAPRILELVEAGPNYRYRGLDALGRLGNPKVIPGLERLLEEEESETGRYRIALALARLGRRDPLAAIVDAEDFSADPLVEAEALIALDRRDAATELLDSVEMEHSDNGSYLYNVGSAFARMGFADRAFRALGRALELRPLSRDQIANNADLDTLREDDRFAELLEKAR